MSCRDFAAQNKTTVKTIHWAEESMSFPMEKEDTARMTIQLRQVLTQLLICFTMGMEKRLLWLINPGGSPKLEPV